MKKLISSLLVMVVLFNFIFGEKSYATDFEGTDSIKEDTISPDEMYQGVNGDDSGDSSDSSTSNANWDIVETIFLGSVAGILASVVNLFPILIEGLMSGAAGGFFTIEKAVFNLFGIFDVNYFDFGSSYKIGNKKTKTVNTDDLILDVRESIAKFYYILRLVASALNLLILIYVGIRMALSTISSDKAKYKKMLLAWFESLVVLFMMQYIIILVIKISGIFTNVLYDIRTDMIANGSKSFEDTVIENIFSSMMIKSGWTYVMYSIIFWFLVFIQTKFFLLYFKRQITVGFLIMISPIISVVYPIDKIGDGKAQSFVMWFNEFAINVFIQPIHAFIYLAFMFTAGEIANKSLIVAMIFMLFMTKVEKIILQLFNLKNVVSIKSVDDERKK